MRNFLNAIKETWKQDRWYFAFLLPIWAVRRALLVGDLQSAVDGEFIKESTQAASKERAEDVNPEASVGTGNGNLRCNIG